MAMMMLMKMKIKMRCCISLCDAFAFNKFHLISTKRFLSSSTGPAVKPLILLDVDRVLNNFDGNFTWGKPVYKGRLILEYIVTWVPAVVEKFNSWSDNGLVEVR